MKRLPQSKYPVAQANVHALFPLRLDETIPDWKNFDWLQNARRAVDPIRIRHNERVG